MSILTWHPNSLYTVELDIIRSLVHVLWKYFDFATYNIDLIHLISFISCKHTI